MHVEKRLRPGKKKNSTWEVEVDRAFTSLANTLAAPAPCIEDVANVTLDHARGLTGSAHGFVSAIDPETGESVVYTLTAMIGKECTVDGAAIRFPREADGKYAALWGHALNTGQAFYTNSPQTHPASTGLPSGHVPLRNFLAAPAVVASEVVGLIALANADKDYGERELDAVERMARFFGLVVKHKRAEEALAADLAAMSRLHDVSSRFMEEGQLSSLLQLVIDAAVEIAGADMGTLQTFDPTGRVLRIVAQRGFDRSFLDYFATLDPRHPTPCGQALKQRRRVIVEDVETDPILAGTPSLDALRVAGVRAVQSTPLVNRSGRFVGMLNNHWRQPHHPGERVLRLIDLLARQAADIIDRKLAEEALRESEERFRLVLEGGQLGFWEWNIETGEVKRNARWAEMLGYAPHEIKSTHEQWTDLIHPADQAAALRSVNEHLENQTPHYRAEYQMRAADGDYRWILDQAAITVRDDQGKALWVCGTHTDITEIKRLEEALENAFEHEHRIAHVLQEALIPQISVSVPGYEIEGSYYPAVAEEEVCGDFYDVFQLSDGHIALVIGDVAGKGLDAAVYTAMCKNILRGFTSETPWPAITLHRIDKVLLEALPEAEFITLAFALLDPETGKIRYASAGHEPALIYRADTDSATTLDVTGHALGSGVEGEFKEIDLVMGDGDIILFYTDGLIEAGRPDNCYGIDGIERALRTYSTRPAKELLAHIMSDSVERDLGRRSDDKGVMALKRVAQS